MVRKKQVVGLKMISLQDGKEVGEVKDVIYDPKKKKVEALIAEEKGIVKGSKVVPLDEVHTIGDDAVTIDSEERMKPLSKAPEPVTKAAKLSQKVEETTIVTTDGKELGNIKDVYFNPLTGEVEEFEMLKVNEKGGKSKKKKVILSEVLTIGEEVTVVRGYGENIFPSQSEDVSQTKKNNLLEGTDTSITTIKNFESLVNKSHDIQPHFTEEDKKLYEKIVAPSTASSSSSLQTSSGKGIWRTFHDWLIGPTIQEAISQITGIPRKI